MIISLEKPLKERLQNMKNLMNIEKKLNYELVQTMNCLDDLINKHKKNLLFMVNFFFNNKFV